MGSFHSNCARCTIERIDFFISELKAEFFFEEFHQEAPRDASHSEQNANQPK
jgi:hypothetical protein